MEPSQFYTGLVADLYASLRSHVYDDPVPWERFIVEAGEPALELGCGDGDPLLALRQRGLDVEGVDSSPDMLERCRTAAAEQGLTVTLHCQKMEELRLGHRYRSIFLAGPTFNLLPDDDTALRALTSIREHLAAAGQALVPLFVPRPTPPEQLGLAREQRDDDGSVLRVTPLRERFDAVARTRTTLLRYERRTAEGEVERIERPWVLHWYDLDAFRRLAGRAGLEVTDVRIVDPDAAAATWHLRLGHRPSAGECTPAVASSAGT
jgi:SAM-dependent methyltransferase